MSLVEQKRFALRFLVEFVSFDLCFVDRLFFFWPLCRLSFDSDYPFGILKLISWESVLLVEETEYPADLSPTNCYHIMLCRVHLTRVGYELKTLVVVGTECTGSCKSNYHTIMTPKYFLEENLLRLQ